MGNSDYNLDSLIAWCSSLKTLLRATSYLPRTLGRRFLRRGEIDVSEYCIQQGEISRSDRMPGTSWYLGNIAKDWIERDIKICVQ